MRLVHIASAVLACVVFLAALPAEAQSRRIRNNNWRKRDRGSGVYQGTPQRFALELRFGPYYPHVDQEAALRDDVFNTTFESPWFFNFGTEFDWQVLRIPWVGTVGPGVGIGYVSPSGAAWSLGKYGSTNQEDRKNETSLTIIPMHLSAVVRFDEIFRRTQIPLVPYGKIGLGYGIWWCTVAGNDCDDVDGDEAKGASLGLHWAIGGSIALDFLGRREMSALDQETGVNHVHIFGEWYNQNLGLALDPMRVGTSTWMTGLMLEM